jgi:hypothetical protein
MRLTLNYTNDIDDLLQTALPLLLMLRDVAVTGCMRYAGRKKMQTITGVKFHVAGKVDGCGWSAPAHFTVSKFTGVWFCSRMKEGFAQWRVESRHLTAFADFAEICTR